MSESEELANINTLADVRQSIRELPIFQGQSWEDHVQAFLDIEVVVTDNRWKQAAIINSLEVYFGENCLEQFAKDVGVAHRRIYDYRMAYQAYQSHIRQFPDRPVNLTYSHYVVAGRADNPAEVLEMAATNGWRVRDLNRHITQSTAPPIDAELPAISEDPAIVQAWDTVRRALAALKSAAPSLGDLIDSAIDDLQYEISLPPGSVKGAMMDAIRRGYDDLDAIAQHLKKHRDHVSVWLNRLEELGEIERHEAERAPGARGPARTFYTLSTDS